LGGCKRDSRKNVSWMIGEVKTDRFNEKVTLGGDVMVRALEGILKD
jgi:hypothetical protein